MGLLKWSVIAAIISVIFAVLGFGNVAHGFADIAKILFGIFCFIFVAVLVLGIVIARKVF